MTTAKDESLESLKSSVKAILLEHGCEQSELLPILHAIQDSLGYIPLDAVDDISKALNLSRAEVHGVITYYHHFRNLPAGRHLIQLCRAEACQSMGADALLTHAETLLGCKLDETTSDGRFTLEAAYCLGLCACSPALSVNGEVHARMTPKLFDELIISLKDEA
jgi:formate dehydrogenase subunit gamma